MALVTLRASQGGSGDSEPRRAERGAYGVAYLALNSRNQGENTRFAHRWKRVSARRADVLHANQGQPGATTTLKPTSTFKRAVYDA